MRNVEPATKSQDKLRYQEYEFNGNGVEENKIRGRKNGYVLQYNMLITCLPHSVASSAKGRLPILQNRQYFRLVSQEFLDLISENRNICSMGFSTFPSK